MSFQSALLLAVGSDYLMIYLIQRKKTDEGARAHDN